MAQQLQVLHQQVGVSHREAGHGSEVASPVLAVLEAGETPTGEMGLDSSLSSSRAGAVSNYLL